MFQTSVETALVYVCFKLSMKCSCKSSGTKKQTIEIISTFLLYKKIGAENV